MCGCLRHARQVGYALRKGLAGKEVPAHRIVNARGMLSGAAAFESPGLQKLLLEQEGIRVEWTKDGWTPGRPEKSEEDGIWKNGFVTVQCAGGYR